MLKNSQIFKFFPLPYCWWTWWFASRFFMVWDNMIINHMLFLFLKMPFASESTILITILDNVFLFIYCSYALQPSKARAVAEETLLIWCSLASRLGLWALKAELEDLCFAVLQVSSQFLLIVVKCINIDAKPIAYVG